MIKRRRGISPVIAIVILIAVAVALGIAVAFWATGLIGTLGKVEKLEIRTAYAESNDGTWTITMKGANTGTADITVVEITINGKPISQYGGENTASANIVVEGQTRGTYADSYTTATIKSGEEFTVTVGLDKNNSGFTAGQTIEIALISGSGTAFKRTVVLP